jgi:hypothetical protein
MASGCRPRCRRAEGDKVVALFADSGTMRGNLMEMKESVSTGMAFLGPF